MARHWKLTSTSTRYAFAWAALVLWNPSHAPPATQAFWTRARRTPPAAPSVRPRVVTTQCPLLFMQLHSSAITPLKWRFLASFPGTDLRPADILTSALGNAYTALDVSICSPHASEAGVDCNQSRVQAKLEHYGPPLGHPSSPKYLLLPNFLERQRATSPRHVGRFCALSANPLRANATSLRPRSSFTDCTPASHLRSGDVSARQVRACWPVTALPGRPGSGCLAPVGCLFSRLVLRLLLPCAWSVSPGFPPSLLSGLSVSGRTPALRFAKAAHGGLPFWCPRG